MYRQTKGSLCLYSADFTSSPVLTAWSLTTRQTARTEKTFYQHLERVPDDLQSLLQPEVRLSRGTEGRGGPERGEEEGGGGAQPGEVLLPAQQ